MTAENSANAQKLQLLTKASRNGKVQKSFNVVAGDGDAGVPLRIKAESATHYELRDPKTERAPERVRAKRVGRDLEIFFEGSEKADIVIEQYYDEAIVEFPKDSLTGILPKGDLAVYVIDEGLRPALTTLESKVTPIILLENVGWLPHWWVGLGAAGAAAVLMGDNPVPPPGVPTAQLAASSDTGSSQTDRLTADNTPTLTGTGTAGNAITIKDDAGRVIATAIVAADGTWSATPTANMANGVYNLSVIATNSAGVAAAPVVLNLTIDAAAPAAPVADVAANSDTGLSNNDNITGDTTPEITGTGTAGDTITVTMPGTGEVLTTVVAVNGTWSVTPTQALAVGLVGNATVTATDAAGNVSQPTLVPLTIVGDLIITGSVAAGPVNGGVTLYAYDESSNLLGETVIQSDGTYTISTPSRGDYRGTVLLKVVDANAAATNYLDEVTAAEKSLNTELRAMGLAQEGHALFSIVGQDAHLIINITPLTELAVRQAGVSGNTPVTATAAQAANTNVAVAFGLTGVDITGAVTPTNSATFDARNGLSNAEKYGIALTKLSGLDSLNAGNMATSLNLLAANLNGSTLTTAGATLVDQGRAQALSNLMTGETTFRSGAGDTDNNTVLNRQLLGEIMVTAQDLDPQGHLVISGTALPGATLTITLPDGSTQTTVVDSTGNFSLTSARPQPSLENPVKVQGVDALSAPVANAAPNAPQIDTGNGKVVTGSADPGTTVTVRDAQGNLVGTAQTDALGHWSLTPSAPLANATGLKASAVDLAGNASGPGTGITDINALVIVVPEASDGYVNATEKASGGGVPITVSLPGDAAVGDIITSRIILPDGSTQTLTRVLDAADVAAGTITQLMGPAQLPVDGLYQVSSTRTNAQGTSAPSLREFVLDTAVPAAPEIAPSNGQIITGTAEPGTLVTVRDGQGNVIGVVGPVGAGGNWTLVPATPLVDGAAITATAQDPAGNTSGPGAGEVDTGALLITGAIDNLGPRTGLLGDGAYTNDSTPQLTGTLGTPLAAGQTLAIYREGVFVGNATVSGNTWTFQDGSTAPLADGPYAYEAKVQQGSQVVQTSGVFNLIVDNAPSTPGVLIPDAPQGVSTAEALDGVALRIALPQDAMVGDIVTTVITLPDGVTTLTRTTVLTEAMVTVGTIVQTVTNAELGGPVAGQYHDGSWATSTTITDLAGNTSPAMQDGFRLAANAPSLTLAPVTGDNIVNAAEKAGDLPVTGTTSAEPGQAVTITLVDANNQPIGTYYTTVKADGTFALNIPQADLPADGTYNLKADVSNSSGTPAVQQAQSVLFDTVAPVITVTSVAGDAVAASGNGLFNGAERGFDTTTYALSDTVATLPVISGTTDAQAGQTVTVLLNHVVYTTTVQTGGIWSVTLGQADAKALVHGNTYDIRVSVSDVAGNPALPDTNNGLVVDIAPPDVPTIHQQYASSLTPVITGGAQKLANGSPIALANGDTLSFTLNGVTVTVTIDSSQASGTSLPGVSYDPATKAWSLDTAVAGSFDLADDQTYNVAVSVTAAGIPARSDVSAGELVLNTTPPVITLHPISPDANGDSVINGFEQNQSLTLTGTTDAEVGQTVTLTGLGGQTYTATVMPGTNGGPNTFSIPVSGADIAAIADGTLQPQVSVTNIFGLTGTDAELLLVDTTAPSTPVVALPESSSGVNAAEAASAGGTPLVVTLPQDAAAGDTVTSVVTKADGSTLVLTRVLTPDDITAGNITQLIPTAELDVDGPWTTSTTITDPSGNTSAPQSGAFLLDTQAPGEPGVSLPESPYGVNADEAASLGGTPLDISLPGNAAVGDVVTTTVTLPNGSTLTLNSVLTAADIASGTVTQVIPTADLTVDGTWTTSTTVTDLAGNTGPARAGSFVLDTTAPAAPAADVAALSDTGASNTDNNTSDNTPTISGTGTAGDTITVTFPGGEVQTAVVAADGTWSVTPNTALPDGAQTVLVTATDPAGNMSPASQVPVIIDTTAPVAPTIDLADASDTGSSNTDNVTADNTPTLRGTGVPGDTVNVYNAQGQVVATAVVDGNGNWSAVASTLPDGLNNLVAKATDTAGNEGPGAPLAVTVDTAAPAAPVADVAASSDSGTSNTDNLTNDNTPTISGTGVAGDTITVTFPGGEVQTAVVASNGTWSVTPLNPLADGPHNVSVTATDPAGNVSPASTVALVIDTTPPAAPVADVVAASDTGASNTDNNTSDNTPTISGTGTAGDTITVTFPGGEVKTAVVAANGTWSVTPTNALPDGAQNVTVTATDPAGNVSPATTVPVVIDTTAPAAPTVNPLTTNDSTPVLTGTATLGAGETLQVTVNGATYNVTVGVGGNWSLDTGTATPASGTLGAFVSGTRYPVTATTTDLAGNATSDSTTNEVLFDNTAPSTPTVNALATNDSTPVLTGTANLLSGETLQVTVNGATYAVAVATDGTWSLDTGTATPVSGILGVFVDGTRYPVTATITDLANNSTSDSTTNELLFDTTAPNAPVGDVAAASDSGTSNTDNLTNDTTPTIVGTGTPGDTIKLYAADGTTLLGTTVVDAAGNWAITPANALPQGLNNLQVTATDPAGNTSAPGTVPVTIDTSAPAAPTAVLDPSSDTGAQGDSTTSDNTPTLSGTGTAGDTITIKDANGNIIATAVVDSNGNWQATPANALPNGLNNLSVTATDPAGNTSAPAALPITIDTTASAAPVASLAAASDSGIVGDSITSDNTPTIEGTGTPGDTIKLYAPDGTTLLGTAVVASNGTWAITPASAQPDGLNNFKVNATDPAGNVSAFATVPVTIDTAAPNAPAADVAALSDTGSSNTDNITSDNTPAITGGGATPGDTITVTMPGTGEVLTAVVAANGSWSVTPTQALADGAANVSVTATDPQGNTSAATLVPVTIDTTAPAAPVARLDNSSNSASTSDNITNDNTPLLSGTGVAGDTITVKDANGNTLGTAVVANDGTWSFQTTVALPNGPVNFEITATDPAGNVSAPATLPVVIDTVVATPVITPTNGRGDISGTGEPGATVTLKDAANNVIGTAVVGTDGTWSITPSAPVANGTALSATQTDVAGNLSSPGTTTVDNNVPNINPTNGTVLTGTGQPGHDIALTLPDGTPIRDANGAPLVVRVDSNGNWSATPGTPLADGTIVKAKDTTNGLSDTEVVDAVAPTIPMGDVAAASDSGTSNTDNVTNDTTPEIVGTGTPGDTIKLYAPNGTTLLGTAVVAADGSWAITPVNALSEGLNNLQVTATDPAGNTSAPGTVPVTIDTTAPAAPVADVAAASDTGASNTDNVTSDTTPTISGTGTTGDTITVTFPGGEVKTAVVASDGSWSVTPVNALPAGVQNVSVTATDPAGNTGPAASVPVTIDTTAASAPTGDVAASSDSGVSNTDNITSDNTPTISGTGTAGDTITVTMPGTGEVLTTVVASNGTWSVTPTQALADGTANVTVVAADPAGNTSPSDNVPVTIDTTAPAAPAADVAAASDTGSSNTDNITRDNTPTISGGGATPGHTITVTMPGTGEVLTAVVASDGSWSVTPTQALADGTANVSVTATDPAGNTSTPTLVPVTIDTTAPAAPVADVAASSDTGSSNTDNNTSDNTPTISGTGVAGDTITVTMPGTNEVLTVVVASDGTWSVTPTQALADGTANVTVTATDPAGNVSAPATVPVVIDTTPPAAPVVTPVATADLTPTITGTATLAAGETLQVTVNGATYVVAVGSNGTWALDTGTATPISGTLGTFVNGNSYDVVATTIDAAGNSTSDVSTGEVTIDTSLPPSPAGDVAASSDSGSSNTDNVTSDTTPEIVGTGTPGHTIKLYAADGTTLLGTGVVASDGTWSITPTSALPQGLNNLVITATDAQNRVSAPAIVPVTIDTTASVPTADVAAASDTGSSNTDNITRDNTPTLSGTGVAGDTITVTMPGTGEVLTTVVAADGSWSVTPTQALADGTANASVTSTDPAGNTSAAVLVPITIDTTAPAAPVADVAAASDTGSSNTDNITRDNTPTISGTGVAGNTITVTMPGTGEVLTAVVASNGTWSVTPTQALADGTANVTVTATDAAGNVSAPATVPVTIDTTAPAAPVADVAAASDTGASNTDNVTRDNTPTISGTGTAGDTITVTMPGTNEVLTVVVASDGTWSVTPTQALADGTANVSVTATDPAGNTSPASLVPVTIDTAAPTPTADVATASDSGSSNTDNNTSDTTPTISGTGVAGNTITVTMPGTNEVLTVVVASDGTWSVTPTQALANGSLSVSVTETDAAGNSGTVSVPVVIDTTPPAAPVVTPLSTADTTPTITGTASLAASETLKVTVNGATYAVTVANDGSWSLDTGTATPVSGTLGSFNIGQTYGVTATVTDAAGNSTSDTSSGELSIIAVSLSGGIDASSDSGIAADGRTNDTTPTITGQGLPGETIKLFAPNGTTLLGTTVVLSDGSWAITPTSALTEGLQNLVIQSFAPGSSTAGASATVPVTIDTTAAITITSVAGDAVAASGNGTFSIGERGFDSVTYTLNNTVTTPPVLSGTSTADTGSTVTLTLNGKTYTTTVQAGGTWAYTLSDADAKLLNHGNTYAITASVTDAAANVGTDTNNGVVVNIAPPDVPTVNNLQNITTLLPTITGAAHKIDNLNNTINLQTGDVLTVALKSGAGATLATYTLTVGANAVTTGTGGTGVNANTELSYDKTTGVWTLGAGNGIPVGVFTRAGIYNVDVTTTVPDGAGFLSRSDVSSSEITIVPTAPIIDSTAWSTTNLTSDLMGVQEAYYDSNSAFFRTPSTSPSTPTVVDNRLWYSEASTPTNTAGTVVRVQLPNNTATPTAPVSVPVGAGDVMQLTWGDSTTTQVTLSATDITNNYVDVTVPYSVISAQSFGDIAVSAQLLVAGTTLQASSATLTATYFFDLPLANTGGVVGDNFGYQINGRPSDNIGAKSSANTPGTVMVGDVNGDGYDDMVIGAGQTNAGNTNAAAFVVFGSSAPQNVDLSAIAAGSSTQGFMVAGLTAANSFSLIIDHGDFNGDGLDDISFAGAGAGNYIVYGRVNSTATVQVSSLTTTATSNGLKVTSSASLNNLGDLNGDGVQDWGTSFATLVTWRSFYAKYGVADATTLTVNSANTDFTLTSGDYLYNDFATSADVNGDGYSDLVLRATSSQDPNMPTRAEIYFGSATGLNATQRYSITGLGGFQGEMIGTGDINGDGKADMVTSVKGSVVYVNFGKSTTANYNVTELSTGNSSNGFMVQGVTGGTQPNVFLQARVVGDFNGDGLDDFVFRQENMTINGANTGGGYLIYGKTSSSTIYLTDLQVSEGFRIDGVLGGDKALTAVSGGGDVNGDGFADLIVSSPNAISTSNNGVGQASGATAGGVDYIIYGGPSVLNPMVFQASRGDLIGTGAAETLTGNSGNNQIVGGQGDDTLVGAGGVDMLSGGVGNDVFVLNADNVRALAVRTGVDVQNIARVDGGGGMDTLRFGEALVLSLQSARTRLENLERFDLAATGGTLQIETGLDVNATVGDYNRFNTANGWTVTGTVTGFDGSTNYYQVVVDGSSADTVRLGAGFVKETGSLTYSGSVTAAGAYDVYTSASTRSQVLVKQGVQVVPVLLPAAAITLPEADLLSSFGFLSLAEAQDTGNANATSSLAGTPVLVSLAGLGAAVGDQVRVNWENQPAVLYTLTADDLTAGYARVSVPASALLAATAVGTKETLGLTAQVFNAAGVPLTTVGSSTAAVDFLTTPSTPPLNAPIISNVNGSTSVMAGMTEVVNTNVIYRSAALDGVQVSVSLKTAAAAGDWLKFTWGNQEYTYKFTAAVATNTPTTITIPYAVLEAQGYGTFNVSVQQFKADGVSGTAIGAANTVTGVRYAFDMQANEGATDATRGLVLMGEANYHNAGYALSNAGDVNGDGFDDFIVGAPGAQSYAGRSYVVFGGSKLPSTLQLSELTVVGNTRGFVINGTGGDEMNGATVSGGGDINGDGLADLVVANRANFAIGAGWYPMEYATSGTNSATYVVFGKANTTAVNLTALTAATNLTNTASTLGFKINTTGTTAAGWSVSNAGDVNGDGLDDMLVGNPTYGARDGRAYLIYGKASGAAVEVNSLPGIGVSNSVGFMVTADKPSTNSGLASMASGDINGDGYSDLVLGAWYEGSTGVGPGGAYVVYGSATNTSLDISTLSAGTSSRGFQIVGEGTAGIDIAGVGDVNGDGLEDVLLQGNQGLVGAGNTTLKGAAWVVFGKTDSNRVHVSDIEAGNGGFAIGVGLDTTNYGAYSVSSAGDFNGDGLTDVIVTHANASFVNNGVTNTAAGAAYIVFGKTGTGTVQVTSLDGSEGFRIVNPFANEYMGSAVSGGGDINGDGFDDVIIGNYKGDTTLTDMGKVYVVYGGVSNQQSTVFQVSNGDRIGTAAADTLTGTTGANQLVGGLGNDTLVGGGGADVLYGGAGHDVMQVNADNLAQLALSGTSQNVMRIDGGGGIDTLKFDGAGLTLDLSNIKGEALQNMEKIDLTGSGNNTLKLNVGDLLENFTSANVWNAGNSSSGNLGATVSRNQLMVTGNAGDTVILSDLANWAATLPANVITINGNTYTGYNLGAAQLLIDTALTVSAT